jgi:hypothetical protein
VARSDTYPLLRDYHAIAHELPESLHKKNWGVYYDDYQDAIVVYAKGTDGELVKFMEDPETFPSNRLISALILLLSS